MAQASITVASIQADTHRNIGIWLIICCVMVASMVLVGGLTRLTESGLSITVWNPIHGTIPPLSDADWQEEFAAYQTSPEYIHKNQGMSLSEFKYIFWWEYGHRLLGRMVGLVFLLPLIFFYCTKAISSKKAFQLLGIFALGGLQGLMGWVMVKSGLQDMPMVSPVKLAAHLLLAFAIFALILWQTLNYLIPAKNITRTANPMLHWLRHSTCLLLILQISLGALVAGNHAGIVYNSFPTMEGQWIPSEIGHYSPFWHDMLQNHATIQWLHRLIGTLALLMALAWSCLSFICFKTKQTNPNNLNLIYLPTIYAITLLMQYGLGVATLLAIVPISLASWHQMMALLLVAWMVLNYWMIGYATKAV